MKALMLCAIFAGCVVNENGETDAPPPCETAVMDSSGLKRICQQVEMVEGEK